MHHASVDDLIVEIIAAHRQKQRRPSGDTIRRDMRQRIAQMRLPSVRWIERRVIALGFKSSDVKPRPLLSAKMMEQRMNHLRFRKRLLNKYHNKVKFWTFDQNYA